MIDTIDVDTLVGENLGCLDRNIYRVERKPYGKNIEYTVYKHGKRLGVYLIRPGTPGGPIDGPENKGDKALAAEWDRIVFQMLVPMLVHKFGPFHTWEKPGESGTVEVRLNHTAGPLKPGTYRVDPGTALQLEAQDKGAESLSLNVGRTQASEIQQYNDGVATAQEILFPLFDQEHEAMRAEGRKRPNLKGIATRTGIPHDTVKKKHQI